MWQLSRKKTGLKGIKFLQRQYHLKKQVTAMRKCLRLTTICMKVMKVTTMMAPIMMISVSKSFRRPYYFLQCDANFSVAIYQIFYYDE